VALAVVTAASVGIPASLALTTDAGKDAVVVEDAMTRTLAQGWGSAQVGGPYKVTDAAATRMEGGAGFIDVRTPGTAISAVLPETSVLDTAVKTQISVTPPPDSGRGVYTSVLLRHQSERKAYAAIVRTLPGGQVRLSFNRIEADREVNLGGETVLSEQVLPGEPISVSARITGSSPVVLSLSATLPRAGSGIVWTHAATDSSDASITRPGSVGLRVYLSRSSQSAETVRFAALRATDLSVSAPTPTPTASATPTPSVSSTATPTPSVSTTPTPSVTPSPEPTPDPAPGDGGEAGSLPVGSARYAVPADAIIVSPSGSDSASGSAAAPLRTVARAIQLASSGRTIVLRGGVYHENVQVPGNKRLTLQNYPGEAVWFDGSRAVSGWRASGNAWVLDGWTPSFDSTPAFNGKPSNNPGWSFINDRYPMAAHPDMVFVDGASLQQVASRDKVTKGTFYLDDGADRLYIGTDPAGHDVRASDLPEAIALRSSGSVLRGIGVRRYATSVGKMGTVKATAPNILVENVRDQ
jgi:hypothetical protein